MDELEIPSVPEALQPNSTQGIDGEILEDKVTKSTIPHQSVSEALSGFATEGSRALSGSGSTILVAASFHELQQRCAKAENERDIERLARHNAEIKIAGLTGKAQSASAMNVLGALISLIGTLFMALGLSYESTTGVEIEAAPFSIGLFFFITGYAVPAYSRREKK